jgi:hypothetical protein
VFVRTVNGKDTVLFVPAGSRNGGVVNITDFEVPQLPELNGPFNVNCMDIVCVVLVQDVSVPVTVIFPPTATVEGESVIDT